MSALPKSRHDSPKSRAITPKPPVSGGSDSSASALVEEFRRRTDYDADSGYGPMYFAAAVEIPRLTSGAVCSHFLMMVGLLSYGRADKPKKGRQVWTLPVTVEQLAELCRCHVRDIQRQLADLAKPSKKNPLGRGLIDVKSTRRGEYEISPLYRAWASLPAYSPAVAKVVPIDEAQDSDDTAAVDPPREAVRLVKRPQRVRDGRACRAVPVNVGVRRFKVQHHGPDLTFDLWVDVGGDMVISTQILDGEVKANARDMGVAKGSGSSKHPRAAEVVALFDPLLEKSASRLLMGDDVALARACAELDGIPHDVLVHFVMVAGGSKSRASRSISGPKVVASIIREAVAAWRGGLKVGSPGAARSAPAGSKGGFAAGAKRGILRQLERERARGQK